jgi:hypothetical protein
MQPIGRSVALALVSLAALAACTGDDEPPAATTPPGGETSTSTSTVPTPAETFTGVPGTATYTYALERLTVTVELDGSEGTMLVENGSEHDLDAPGLYVLDAVDGHEVDGEVLASAPVAAGDSATFDVALDGVGVEDIGLLVLLFGADDYGAFVRTG